MASTGCVPIRASPAHPGRKPSPLSVYWEAVDPGRQQESYHGNQPGLWNSQWPSRVAPLQGAQENGARISLPRDYLAISLVKWEVVQVLGLQEFLCPVLKERLWGTQDRKL